MQKHFTSLNNQLIVFELTPHYPYTFPIAVILRLFGRTAGFNSNGCANGSHCICCYSLAKIQVVLVASTDVCKSSHLTDLIILLMVQKSVKNQLRLVVYPIIYRVLDIPGGCLGFSPPTVSLTPKQFHHFFRENPSKNCHIYMCCMIFNPPQNGSHGPPPKPKCMTPALQVKQQHPRAAQGYSPCTPDMVTTNFKVILEIKTNINNFWLKNHHYQKTVLKSKNDMSTVYLVGGFNPFENYQWKLDHFPNFWGAK